MSANYKEFTATFLAFFLLASLFLFATFLSSLWSRRAHVFFVGDGILYSFCAFLEIYTRQQKQHTTKHACGYPPNFALFRCATGYLTPHHWSTLVIEASEENQNNANLKDLL